MTITCSKPHLVLIPGLNCSDLLWQPQIDALKDHATITVADVRANSLDEMADRILATAPPRFHAAGLSMGGYVIFALLRKAPERLISIALIDTAANDDTDKVRSIRDAQIATVKEGGFHAVVDRLWPLLVHQNNNNNKGLREVVDAMAAWNGPEAFIEQLEALKSRPDSRPDLGKITVPTLIIVGDGDRLTPPSQSQEMAAAIPNASLHVLEDCGHLSTLEQPDMVNRLLAQWLTA